MNERQKKILKIIIEEYIKTSTPVSSSVLVEKYKLDISSATARNEMAILESNNYIQQPHVSAGRIPTQKAYFFYILELEKNGLTKNINLGKNEKINIEKAFFDKKEINIKKTAKELAHISNLAIFWAINKNNLYYTGISNLFSQPEFKSEKQDNLVYDFSQIIDRLDDVIYKIFDKIPKEPQIFIGDKNPFSPQCATVLTKYTINKQKGLFGVLGPTRMDYLKTLSLINFINTLIQEL